MYHPVRCVCVERCFVVAVHSRFLTLSHALGRVANSPPVGSAVIVLASFGARALAMLGEIRAWPVDIGVVRGLSQGGPARPACSELEPAAARRSLSAQVLAHRFRFARWHSEAQADMWTQVALTSSWPIAIAGVILLFAHPEEDDASFAIYL